MSAKFACFVFATDLCALEVQSFVCAAKFCSVCDCLGRVCVTERKAFRIKMFFIHQEDGVIFLIELTRFKGFPTQNITFEHCDSLRT